MTFNECLFLDKPTITISCDLCDTSMYMNEIKELQHFPQTQNSIHICSDCAATFVKKELQKYITE